MSKFLTALPVFNEKHSVSSVLDLVCEYSPQVLVVDDGSNDGSSDILQRRKDIHLVQHPENRGYGAALQTAFDYAIEKEFEVIVTIDCDGQHEPQRIQQFVNVCCQTGADIISGSRYRTSSTNENGSSSKPPADRRLINRQITEMLNRRLNLELTDAFCGFKAYRVSALKKLHLTEPGYAMPLELWVQAACNELSIIEISVPLIYLDANRTFGGQLDNPTSRLEYYQRVLKRSFDALPDECSKLKVDTSHQ
jgi:glycosyltransferase involved in cell wall biosynthesis